MSDCKISTESHHIQGSQHKRSYDVFRECEVGSSGGYSDEHICKKIKGADHEATRNSSEHKPTSYGNNELLYTRKQHGVGFNWRNVKKTANHCGKRVAC